MIDPIGVEHLPLFDPPAAPDGRALRDAALDRFRDPAIVAAVRAAMLALYRQRAGTLAPYVTADDASEWVDLHRADYPGDRRFLGQVFRPGSGWRACGWEESRLARRHARPVRQWEWIGEREDGVAA